MSNEYKEWLKEQTFESLANDNLRIKLELKTAKEENELLKSNDCEKCENSENKNIHCWDCLCAKLNIVKQQNKQMMELISEINLEYSDDGILSKATKYTIQQALNQLKVRE